MLMNFSDILSNKYVQIITNSKLFQIWETLAFAVGIFIFIIILKNIFTKYVIKMLNKLFDKLKIRGARFILGAFEDPIKILFIIVDIYIFLLIVTKALGYNSGIFLNRCLGTGIMIVITMGLINIANNSDEFLEKASDKYNLKVNTVLIPTVCKVIKFLIYAFGIIQIANMWGMDVNGFITGLGLSGVVVALAAKDYASNMMSGAIILLDNAFTIGDWIMCGDLEGTVEDISFRSTKIRTPEKILITVPNSILVNTSVYNYNKRETRRVSMDIGLTYDTTKEQLEACNRKIADMLSSNERIDKDGIMVKFDSFGESSLNIKIIFFVNGITYAEYMDVKEEVNYNIMKIVESENADMAFPTRTVIIENK